MVTPGGAPRAREWAAGGRPPGGNITGGNAAGGRRIPQPALMRIALDGKR